MHDFIKAKHFHNIYPFYTLVRNMYPGKCIEPELCIRKSLPAT